MPLSDKMLRFARHVYGTSFRPHADLAGVPERGDDDPDVAYDDEDDEDEDGLDDEDEYEEGDEEDEDDGA